MNIIIDGPDACGKSTYAQKFVSYGYNYEKCSPGEHAAVSTFNSDFFEQHLLKDNFVFDRFFISELVFSELYHRDTFITFDTVNKLVAKYLDTNKFIFMYASDISILKDRLVERGELSYLLEMEQQNNLFMKYAWIFSAYESPNIYIIDVSKYSILADIDNIISKVIAK